MKPIARLLLAAALVLPLAACHGTSPQTSPDSAHSQQVKTTPMQLKLYHVPAQQSAWMAQAIKNATGGANHIRVSTPYPGTLAVYAPTNAQASISQVIGELTTTSHNTAKAATRLQVHFWLVNVVPGKGTDDAALKPLSKTLDRLRASLGASHFVLDETVTATTRLGSINTSDIHTSRGQYQHVYSFQAGPGNYGNIRLNVKFADHSGKTIPQLQTTASLQPGQYVVLAQAPSRTSPHQTDALMHLLIVRVTRPGASS